jgi:inner membrane protein
MQPSQELNLLERFNRWISESITIKLGSIGFLVLILLIPASWIEQLMQERQSRAESVMEEVSDKWSGAQTLSGPILVIPYKVQTRIDHGKEGTEIVENVAKYFFLPETLSINGEINPEVLHRGIFDAVVYTSEISVSANFGKPDFQSLGIAESNVQWKDASMIFSINDLRGISDKLVYTVGDKSKPTEPSNNLGISIGCNNCEGQNPTNGIVTRLGWRSGDDFEGKTSVILNLKGSQELKFIPTGKTTEVQLGGPWPDPSFDGVFLPDSRTIAEKSFTAGWKILHYNRPFSQQWTGSTNLGGSEFGVKLLVPVDQYQKSIRTSKYGVLVILLTFVALFLVEITRKIRIHPFQYILIGVALIIYYTLLISLSEQVGYDAAYWIASTATVALISFYSRSFLQSTVLVGLFTGLLVTFYTFIYIIILQQDFSLLIGSIGLFLIVGALMYVSRKVKWYNEVGT